MKRTIALMLCICMVLSLAACSVAAPKEPAQEKNPVISQKPVGGTVTNLSNGSVLSAAPKGAYNEGTVLVKVEESLDTADLGELAYTSAEPLYSGSQWYIVRLAEGEKAEEAVKYLLSLDAFEAVDYDYVMTTGSDAEEAQVTDNPDYDKQTNLGLHNISYGWTQNGKHSGGSSDVVIAVIDTGVDYTHMDLRNNIWVNTGEIPGNRIDDDGNGYIDDVYGWDCVSDDSDPMDDNGHGTHVAGIIAAENNKIGGIGVAYNCKVMVLKAGNSSGYFNNSDIAEAVQYAYMNGASVINMSFGGSFISVAVEEALQAAYNSCILVAAAGNDSACNNLVCKLCDNKKVSYPAALPYVIGVMSTDASGQHVSSFSNYDHDPHNAIEYEVYAVGEAVPSCWPGNKYATLNGTSMAAPTVSGIAALLRSAFADREKYSTKYIQSQIVNTGTVNPINYLTEMTDGAHSVADVQDALTKIPTPEVNLYDYFIDDSASINAANNGNGIMDAGETVRLYISLHNRGGVATNVQVSIDANRDLDLFTFVNDTITLSDIGTYSVRESGDKYFEIIVDKDCPNDYLVDFNICFTYKNGLEEDKTDYAGDGVAQFNVSSGFHLPGVIKEDTVYKADRRYIVGDNVIIAEGVTVTFEEGCQIQFYDDREYFNSPKIIVYGTLKVEGTQENMVTIAPNERHASFACLIEAWREGNVDVQYADTLNLIISEYDEAGRSVFTDSVQTVIRHSNIRIQGINHHVVSIYYNGDPQDYGFYTVMDHVDHCNIEIIRWNSHYRISKITNSYILITSDNDARVEYIDQLTNNILMTTYIGNSSRYPIKFNGKATVSNNIFLAGGKEFQSLKMLEFGANSSIENNTFCPTYRKYANQVISGYYDASGNPTVDVNGSCSDISALWPHVVSVEMFNKTGEPITTIGKEEITVRVTFNRPMAQREDTYLTFGTIEPYADYRIDGQWVDELVWEGTYTLKAQIENGQNYLKVVNACAQEDPTKQVFGEYQLHEFTIDTTAAMSMNLQAVATDAGIQLTWFQDDYDTLLGYNIYRSEDKNGNFVKLNPSILLPTDESFLDDNAEPGKTYWYTYTVVLSDFTESNPAGKIFCTAIDTLDPTVYHTPVNQGYQNNNLVISCTASDNMQITSVTLYYRVAGAESWTALEMSKANDKYSVTIFGSELTMDALQYYIVATDGHNTVSKGSAEEPYPVVIKDASAASRLGDVDGNGVVTTKDALMLMQCLNKDLILSDDAFKRADLNGDEKLSSAEALRILQYINGNVSTLEM